MDTTSLWSEMQVDELVSDLNAMFAENNLSVNDLLERLVMGDLQGVFHEILKANQEFLTTNLEMPKHIMIGLLLLGILGAVYAQFADVIEKYHLADMVFYSVYLVQTVLLVRCFSYLLEVVGNLLEDIILFVKLIMPVYLMMVAVATGSLTAGAGGQLLLLITYGVEEVFIRGFLPVFSFFFLVSVLEGLDGAERWDNLLNLLKKALETGLKAMVGMVTAVGFMQSMLTPVLDGLRGSVAERVITAMPGLGNSAESVIEIAAGSAIAVKNSVGVLLLILLVVLSGVPLFKILVLAATLKISAALMGIISDKRLTKAVDRSGQAGMLLLRLAGSSMLFFWIAIAATVMTVKL